MKRRHAIGWLDLFTGLLFLALGIVILCSPQLAVSGVVTLLGVAALLSGLSDLVFYARASRLGGYASSALLAAGILSALVGLLVLLKPTAGQWILNVIFPLWLMIRCTARMAGYGFLRRTTWGVVPTLLLCLNAAGVLLGILMLFNTTLFTMSLGILIALDLMILGISDIVEAFSWTDASYIDGKDQDQYEKLV